MDNQLKDSTIEALTIQKDTSLNEVLKQMDRGAEKFLIVADGERMVGVITDGDIRRHILTRGELNGEAEAICNRDPITVGKGFDLEEIKNIMTNEKIEAIPVVEGNTVVDILFWENVFGHKEKIQYDRIEQDIPVVIMAGGKGTRLDPFTRILPKPLIPVGEKPIVEHIIDRFRRYGLDQYYLTVNHKAVTLRAYFEEQDTDYRIGFIEEEKPLGTAGSLRLMDDHSSDAIFVSNCDIIIDTNYKQIVDTHYSSGNDITLVASVKHYNIPYGICEMDEGGMLRSIREKPEYDFLVNTGFYLLNTDTLDLIPENTFFHLTDLIEKVQNQGGKVGVYPVSEKSWLDVGEWDEYKKTIELMGDKL